MDISYQGGAISRHDPAGDRPTIASRPPCWSHEDGEWKLFLHNQGDGLRLFTWGSLALLLRGYARPCGTSGPLDLDRAAEEIRCRYLERGVLAVEGLDGSFTLALLDGASRRVLLYRNLVGTGFTYYRAGAGGLRFGSNLADLVDEAGEPPRPNAAALPAFFLYRFVPGRETLFDGWCSLLPGEQVTWDCHGLARAQRQTFADLVEGGPAGETAAERLGETMWQVLADCKALRPATANLLSGGVDSSYLQAVWNRVAAGDDPLHPSFSVSVDHPRSWQDTDYAVTASRALGTRHTLVPADRPYADYLLDTLSATGEPPNHVQTAYFGDLGRTLASQGFQAGLCGEGADSLFGLGLANRVQNAALLRRLVPGEWLRRGAAAASAVLGCGLLGATLRLSDRLDVWSDLDHPVNQVALFTDLTSVRACFGDEAVAAAAASRRALLDQYRVPANPLDRLHAAGFLGEAMDSASLWATLFNRAGADLLCPFLDSRVIRLALRLAPEVRYPFRRPKDLLKKALARLAPPDLATRTKLGFGQPIFEWLAPGGQLRPLVERIGTHDFLDRKSLERSLAAPNWFLSSLLCYDLWHKLFIERSLPRPAPSLKTGHVETLLTSVTP
jgi:asparagine synthase (glutamine-hydrolysing)